MQGYAAAGILAAVLAGGAATAGARAGDAVQPDATAFRKLFKIVKEQFDADAGKYVWLLETRDGVVLAPSFAVEFQDREGKAVAQKDVEFTPPLQRLDEGDRVRGTARMPSQSVLDRTEKIVVVELKAEAPKEVPLVGTWGVFDYSVKPYRSFDLEITAVKGKTFECMVNGDGGTGTYDDARRTVHFGVGKRDYDADVTFNKAGKWVMHGFSQEGVDVKTCSVFTATRD